MIILLCGLSGAGKTTLATNVKARLAEHGIRAEVIDGDDYRKTFCRDLGFSKADRMENIRRLGLLASRFSAHGIVALLSAINPYEELRRELKATYANVKTVFVDCAVNVLVARDTKGLYKRALLPARDPRKVQNLSGINDPFDVPAHPDLYINTGANGVEESVQRLFSFITKHVSGADRLVHVPAASSLAVE